MKMFTTRPAIALAIAPLLTAVNSANATSYTWSGDSSGGAWASTSNWSPAAGAAGPTTNDTALLDSATANRTITYGASASGNLNTLTINQDAPFINLLELQRGLTLANSIILGATNGGTSQIFINPPTPGGNVFTQLQSSQLFLNAGGVLEFSNYGLAGTDNLAQSRLRGDLAIQGGTFQTNVGVYSSPLRALASTITGNVTMSSGKLSFGAQDPSGNAAVLLAGGGYVKTTDDRLNIEGNLTVTGGTLEAGSATNALYLNGATNRISGLAGALTPQLVLYQATPRSQSLQSDSAIPGGLTLRTQNGPGNPFYSVGSKSGGQLDVGPITLTNRSPGGTLTLQLSSSLTTTSNLSQSASGTSPTFAIDVNGHTLEFSNASFNPFNVSTTKWELTNSGGSAVPGVVKATSFNLSIPTGGASVGAFVNLVATGAGGNINTLSNAFAGIIDPAATFTYNGTAAAANPDKLVSSRTIGNVSVKTGVLQLGSSITSADTSSVVVESGAMLDFAGHSLSTPSLTTDGTVKLTGDSSLTSLTITVGTTSGSSGTLDVSGLNAGHYTLAAGQTIGGSGTIVGNLTIGGGATLSPGNSPGTLAESGNVVYENGGTYQWEINDALGTKGGATGWDWQHISGSLSISATDGDNFIIDLTSLSGASSGNAANFDKLSNYTWTIATANGGITGFDPSKFTLLTSHFSNDTTGSIANGVFSIVTGNGETTLDLVYTAAVVPEPTACVAVTLGGTALLLKRRRKYKAN